MEGTRFWVRIELEVYEVLRGIRKERAAATQGTQKYDGTIEESQEGTKGGNELRTSGYGLECSLYSEQHCKG